MEVIERQSLVFLSKNSPVTEYLQVDGLLLEVKSLWLLGMGDGLGTLCDSKTHRFWTHQAQESGRNRLPLG